jgi:nucleotidyltransferase substrate binding protein (TIGR01987 family)
MSRTPRLKNDFSNILKKWEDALTKKQTEINRDAAILRFELAFEVGWKLIQRIARDEGYEVKSPRQAFQQAFTLGLVTDEVIWTDILKARNTVTHVYQEAYANSLYQQLDKYFEAFKELENNLK